MTSAWFGPKILCRAGINPDSPDPVDTLKTERMRRSMIPVMKKDRSHADCHMLDLIAANDPVDFRVFAMLHTDEDRFRDVTIDILDNRIADEIYSDGLDDLEEDELDEMFQLRKHRIRVVNRNRHIVRTRGPIPYSVGRDTSISTEAFTRTWHWYTFQASSRLDALINMIRIVK